MLPLPLCPGTTAAAGPEVGAGQLRRERIGVWFGFLFWFTVNDLLVSYLQLLE